MDVVVIVLRLVHIIAGITWVGAAIFVFRFIEPTAKELGPKAEPFMTGLVETRKMAAFFMIASGLTVLAGTALFWINSGGDPIGWITRDTTGLAFGLGGLSAWIAFIIGGVAIKPAVEEMAAAGAAAREAGGPPTAEVMARIEAAQSRLATLGKIDIVLIVFASVAMAVARYL